MNVNNEIINAIDMGIILVDADATVHSMNHWFKVHAKIDVENSLNKELREIFDFSDKDYRSIKRYIKSSILLSSPSFIPAMTKGEVFKIPHISSIKTEYNYMQMSVSFILLANTNLVFIALSDQTALVDAHYDINLQKDTLKENVIHLEEQKNLVERHAYYDELTNLPNRRLFYDKFELTYNFAKRNNTKMALIFMDLDNFKQINDSLGHNIGDKLLVSIANTLVENTRDTDIVARMGGDEFILLFSDFKDNMSLINTVKKIIFAIDTKRKVGTHTLHITSSMGISVYPDDGMDVSDLMKKADIALFEVKKSGRNNFQFFEKEMTQTLSREMQLLSDMKEALEKNQFQLFYQAQVDVASSKIIGAEALIRWIHPQKGIIPPDTFIPLAESSSFIIILGDWVLETACLKQVDLGDNYIISINVSVKQIEHIDFVEKLKDVFIKTECNPECIEIEITESLGLRNQDHHIRTLHKMKELGCKLSMDDFGTGYSSLSYLHSLPIDTLKIDQSFIFGIPNSPAKMKLTQTIISMAQNFDLNIIAEGVEENIQLEFIKKHKVNQYQGYFFSKPLQEEKFDSFLKEHMRSN